LGRNEPVRTALINGSNRKHIDLLGSWPEELSSAATAIEQAPNAHHGWNSTAC
jgi:hypothetical protein